MTVIYSQQQLLHYASRLWISKHLPFFEISYQVFTFAEICYKEKVIFVAENFDEADYVWMV